MHIEVNGTRLWFDVDDPALVPDGSTMRERPTVVLLHGGPGSFDDSYFKPDLERLVEEFRRRGGDEVARVVARAYAGERSSVTPEEWLPCWKLFGPSVPSD